MAVSHADPSEFAVSVAVGSAHVLASVLDPLARATRSPALLALPVLAAYLVAVTLAFAVRVAADCYAGTVVACGGGDGAPATVQAQRAGAAAVGGWLADLVVRLAVPALLFSALSFACALLMFSSG